MLKKYLARNRRQLLVILTSLIGVIIAISIFVFVIPRTQKADAVNVCGTISVNTTWTLANSPYVMTCNVTISSGATLTIDPGVVVQANGNYSLTITNATLNVNGNAFASVTFQHISSTAKSAWVGIRINNASANATINYANIQHAAVGVHIFLGTAGVAVYDSTFDTNNVGIRVTGPYSVTTARNKFYKNTYPLAMTSLANTTFGSGVNADILGTGGNLNTYNGIAISGIACAASPTFCPFLSKNFAGITNIPYILDSYNGNISVTGSAAQIRIEEGVIIKFLGTKISMGTSSGMQTFEGALGNTDAIFTSIYDDTVGGDTNNDGSATSPTPGDWTGLGTASLAVVSGNDLSIRYASIGLEHLSAGSTTHITNGSLLNNIVGVSMTGAMTLTNNLIESNQIGVRVQQGGIVTTVTNTFNKNSKYPVAANPGSTTNFGTAGNVDVLGTGSNKNNVNGIGIFGSTVTSCPSNCQIIQRNFAGITNTPYVIIDETFAVSGSTQILTIAAGVRIKFYRSSGFVNAGLSAIAGARFDVNGVNGNPVILTSLYDDTVGGDTNNDSTATSPAQSDWTGLIIASNAATTSDFDYMTLTYSKIGLDITGGTISAASTLDNVTLSSNFKAMYCRSTYSVNLNANIIQDNYYGPIFYANCTVVSTGNTYQRQTKFPIAVNANTSATFGFGGSADTLGSGGNKNGYNAIGLYMEETLDCTNNCSIPLYTFAGISDIPYILLNSAGFDAVSVDSYYFSTGVFDIVDPVIIKASDDAYFQNDGAQFTITGTSQARIYFTSEHDDLVGGDTNNNGTSTSPAPGDWSGFISSGQPGSKGLLGTLSDLDYVKIKYADTGFTQFDGEVAISYSDISNNNVGILVYGPSALGVGLVDNNIELNSSYGIQVANGGAAVVAQNTWWGDPSGPLDSSASGLCGANSGTGNAVTDDGTNNVNYCPFSTTKLNTVALPVVGTVSINSDAGAVNLTENTTTQVSCSTTVTDDDGYTDITQVTAYLYRSGVGDPTVAALNGANNYKLEGNSQCVPSSGTGNTESYTCNFAVQYYADPTDGASPYPAEEWNCRMIPFDGAGQGTASTQGIEMNSLLAVNIPSATLDFGDFFVGSDSGASNGTLTVQNTGNRTIDFQVSADNLCTDFPTCNGNVLIPQNIEYSLSGFTFGTGFELTPVATRVDANLTKASDVSGGPTSTSLFFGVGVPSSQGKGSYSGKLTINGIAN